ncbi:hypothetical protein [Mesorhizobium sp. LSHC414A00]|uniref:hypothetical protein n=1 Tax=Mesorhizobium sp. LSHC414A00 TaxID=1287287 RepID=UPI0012EB40BB|nr:hypothetical protein [Mesorhizobium sp. LSHC414A00]
MLAPISWLVMPLKSAHVRLFGPAVVTAGCALVTPIFSKYRPPPVWSLKESVPGVGIFALEGLSMLASIFSASSLPLRLRRASALCGRHFPPRRIPRSVSGASVLI